MTTLRASYLSGARTSEVREIPLPDVGPHDVLIDITMCGVCMSELPTWLDPADRAPLRLGHEPVGIVREVGSLVTSYAPGQRVTGLIYPAFASAAVAPEENLLAVPDVLSDQAALGEPIACIVNAARRTPVEFGDTVVIIGLGYMGLGMLQMLRLRGAKRIIAVDQRRAPLDRAMALGATEAYAPDGLPADLFLTEFADWNSGKGADVVVEATGSQGGLTLASQLVGVHGLVSILGYHQGAGRNVDVQMWNWKAIDVVNAHVRRKSDLLRSMQIGLDLQVGGQIEMGAFVTHTFALDEVDRAFEVMVNRGDDFVKSAILP